MMLLHRNDVEGNCLLQTIQLWTVTSSHDPIFYFKTSISPHPLTPGPGFLERSDLIQLKGNGIYEGKYRPAY
jgi:hypothetical protein